MQKNSSSLKIILGKGTALTHSNHYHRIMHAHSFALLVGRQVGHPARKKLGVGLLVLMM